MLETAARDVAYPGDIPVLINVLVQSLDIRSAGSGLSRESYEVSFECFLAIANVARPVEFFAGVGS